MRHLSQSLARVFAAVALLACLTPVALAITPLKQGDRVVIYGDSITEQRLYSRYIQQYVYCRYPALNVKFFNAGWGGDTAPGALGRLERDVLSLNPTVVTLFFGMNDGGYKPAEPATIAAYRAGMEGIIKALQAKNIRVVVFTPGCVDYDKNKNLGTADYNKTLEALGNVGKELAEQYHCDFVDVHHPMVKFQAEQKAKQPGFCMIPDSVHPDPAGHIMMARIMLTALAAPMPAIGQVDLSSGKAEGVTLESKTDAKVTLKAETGTAFWIDPASSAVARECGMLDFAGQRLTVKGLPAGFYRVMVDGQIATDTSADQLAAGIALPLQSARAKRLHDLTAAKEDNYFTAWRTVRLGMADVPEAQKIAQAMLGVDEAYNTAIDGLAGASSEITITLEPRPEGANLALGKKYECSNPNGYGWGIGGLTDGSWLADSKTCFATGDAAEFPKTVTIDLEQSTKITTVVLGVPPFGSTKKVTVSISEDGKSFKEVGSHEFSLRKEERYTATFAPASARYVRLTYADHYPEQVNYAAAFAFTTEVEVYAKAAGEKK